MEGNLEGKLREECEFLAGVVEDHEQRNVVEIPEIYKQCVECISKNYNLEIPRVEQIVQEYRVK